MTIHHETRKKSTVVFRPTGLIGNELVKALISDGSYEHITAVVRSPLVLTDPRQPEKKPWHKGM